MSRFIINYDSSIINSRSEPLPLRLFVPGVISLKSLNSYSLVIGELNKSPFFNTIDIFKSNVEIYKKILALFPPTTEVAPEVTIVTNSPVPIPSLRPSKPLDNFDINYGQLKPYVFSNVNPKFIPPSVTANYLNNLRKKAMESMNINTSLVQKPRVPSLPRIPNALLLK
jgi:hypothetical protein